MVKPVKTLVKYLIRTVIYSRLSFLPLSLDKAVWWADVMKRWPAIFGSEPFCRRIVCENGVVMELGIIDVIERNLFVSGRWDQPVANVLQRLLGPGDTFADVGANIGYFSLLASRLVGEKGRVIAFEPSRRALGKLVNHLTINDCRNTLLLSAGLSNMSKVETLYLSTQNNIGATTLRNTPHAIGTEDIVLFSLDNVVKQLHVVPDVIKIDVEGAESWVLEGMRQLLGEHKPVVVAELTESFLADLGGSARGVVGFMEQFGYQCFILADSNELTGTKLTSTGDFWPESQVNVVFMTEKPPFKIAAV